LESELSPHAQVQSYKSRVLFKGACSAIPEDAVLLEVGPHAIMRAPLRQNCAALPYVNAMKKGEDATLSVREAVAGLWRKGAALKWDVPEDVPGAVASYLLNKSHFSPKTCCLCVPLQCFDISAYSSICSSLWLVAAAFRIGSGTPQLV
jgi:hypothetical protein